MAEYSSSESSPPDLSIVLFNCGVRKEKIPEENEKTPEEKEKKADSKRTEKTPEKKEKKADSKRTEKTPEKKEKKADSKRQPKKAVVDEPTRRECVRQVLNKLDASSDPNLIILVQENITGLMHNMIRSCQSTKDEHAAKKTEHAAKKSEAMIYDFIPRESDTYTIEYVDISDLRKVEDSMTYTTGIFTVTRLTACVIKSITGETILLVSWHGPYKIEDIDKAACFDTLVGFLKKLQATKKCSTVMVGGDFNFPAQNARDRLKANNPRLNADVYDEYKQSEDRAGSNKIDYIVQWPAESHGQFCISSVLVIESDVKTESGKSPFDHDIILFRLFDPKLHADSQDVRSDTEGTKRKNVSTLIKLCDEKGRKTKDCIATHDTLIGDKDEHIATLTQECEDKDHHIATLTQECEDKDHRIATLKQESKRFYDEKERKTKDCIATHDTLNDVKDQHIATLTQECEDKDHRIATLTQECEDKDHRIATLKQESKRSLPNQASPDTHDVQKLAERLLKQGRMPLLLPAKRLWTPGRAVRLPNQTQWPPDNWENMTREDKLTKTLAVAQSLCDCATGDDQLTKIKSKRWLLDTLSMLILPRSHHIPEDSDLCRGQTILFQTVRKVAINSAADISAKETVFMLSQLPEPTGVLAEVITALEHIPLRIQ